MKKRLQKQIYVILSISLMMSSLTLFNVYAEESEAPEDLLTSEEQIDDTNEEQQKQDILVEDIEEVKTIKEEITQDVVKSENVISVANAQQLNEAIDTIVDEHDGKGTIVIQNDIVVNGDELDTIEGNVDITITAQSKNTKISLDTSQDRFSRLLDIKGDVETTTKVTFKNMTLDTDDRYDQAYGIGISVTGDADVKLENVNISYFHIAFLWAEKANKDTRNVTVTQSQFINNSFSLLFGHNTIANVSSSHFYGKDGRVANGIEMGEYKEGDPITSSKNSELNVIDCEFNNLYSGHGTAISVNGCEDTKASIKDSYFHDNKATDKGGALYLIASGESFIKIEDCRFEDNAVGDDDSSTQTYRGGAICASVNTMEISRSHFESNETILDDHWEGHNASAEGGAIYFDLIEKDATILLNDCIFKSNEASTINESEESLKRVSVGGGAISLRSADELVDAGNFKMNMNNTTFVANKATVENEVGTPNLVSGGAIDLYSIKENVFKNGEFNFYNCTFENNYAYEYGGALFFRNIESIDFQGKNTIKNNKSAKDGGGIHFAGTCGVMNAEKLILDNNVARYGGGIYANPMSSIDVEEMTLSNNEAQFGGGLFVAGSIPKISASNMKITKNKATETGGGIYIYADQRANIKFEGEIYFSDNTAKNPYSFDLSETDVLNIYNANVKDAVKSLSTPFNLNSSVENMTFAYNSYDINYSSNENLSKNLKVVYDANGATSGDVPLDITEYYPGEEVIALGNTGNLEKTGHKFLGWSVNANAMTPDKSFAIGQEDLTLFAVWETCEYKVTLLDDDGALIDEATALYGESLEIIGSQTKPSDGKYIYTFDKWVPQGDYSLDDLSFIDQDMVFVASYTAVEIKEPISPEEDDDEGDVLGETIEKEENQKDDEKVTLQSGSVQTDDTTPTIVYAVMCVAMSFLLLTSIFYKRRKER